MGTEPTPLRNNGPFRDADAALDQFAAQTHGLPHNTELLCGVVIREATVLTGVDMTIFEQDYLQEFLALRYDPIFAQLVAGWIIRAHLSGVARGKKE